MRSFLFIILLCNASFAFAEDFDVYCKKSLKGKYSAKRKKSVCWCVEDNLRAQLNADERLWLVQKVLPKSSSQRENASLVEIPETSRSRVKTVEFEIFKNCSVNYKWKANVDDIGVPDDINAP